MESRDKFPQTLVCSGAGVKGILYIGVYKALKELNIDTIKRVISVSVGSIFGLCFAAGIPIETIEKKVLDTNFRDLIKIDVGQILTNYGFDNGRRIITWVKSILEENGIKGNITFKELYDTTLVHFEVCAADIDTCQINVFDFISAPNLEVVKAIRMAITVPLLFTTQKYNGKIYIDGAVVDNFPIANCKDEKGVLGINISHDYTKKGDCSHLEGYIENVLKCFLKSNYDKKKTIWSGMDYIDINCDGVEDMFNFNVSEDAKRNMIDIGYKNTMRYFR
uniref:PNPLA domain-containing protein n=1 Tax=viral metagenome TaxID=1070528 RepID=A0A6C0E1W9_9ZZZZ